MSVFETIGLAWVIFTSALGSVATIYLSFVGLKFVFRKEAREAKETQPMNAPVEVKKLFKIAG